MKIKPYPSDSTKEQFNFIEDYLKVSTFNSGRNFTYNPKYIFDSMLYIKATGCSWRSLPHDFNAPWLTVYYHFKKFNEHNVFEKITKNLTNIIEKKLIKKESSLLIIDSRTVKNRYSPVELLGFDGNKKIKGFKQQLIVDTCGFLYAVFIHSANLSDTKQGIETVIQLDENVWLNVQKILADQGYRNSFINDCIELDLPIEISNLKGQLNHDKPFNLDPIRWVVERTISWPACARRLVVNYEKTIKSQISFILLTMLHLGIKRLFQSVMSCYLILSNTGDVN